MSVSIDSMKGYILEEVLAYLIRNTGYHLLVDPSQDPRDLDNRGNGLVVKGRGAVHQVDVLGELKWIPAFTFPIRLFVEAKFRSGTTGIGDVRNAVAVVLDINQNNSPTREQHELYQKYHYAYALFSASGFSRPAADMALAHQISLIDLSGDDYTDLLSTISQAAQTLCGRFNSPDDGSEPDSGSRGIILNVRSFLRINLGTLPENVDRDPIDRIASQISSLPDQLQRTIFVSRRYQELFVGMANGPFMLLLKADNPTNFLNYLEEKGSHNIAISWSPNDEQGVRWHIRPADESSSRSNLTYQLSFKLPQTLSKWISQKGSEEPQRALAVKHQYFRSITIYRHINGQDRLYRLTYNPNSTNLG